MNIMCMQELILTISSTSNKRIHHHKRQILMLVGWYLSKNERYLGNLSRYTQNNKRELPIGGILQLRDSTWSLG